MSQSQVSARSTAAVRRTLAAIALAGSLAWVAALPASADAIDNDEFEDFALGDPVGQFGWTANDIGGWNAANFDIEVVDPSAVWGSALGDRALRVSNAVISNAFGNQLLTPSLIDEAGESFTQPTTLSGGDRQTRFSGTITFASATQTYQPGLGVTLSADRGDGARQTWIRITDEVDGLKVQIGYYDVDIDEFVYGVVASGLARGEVHTLEFTTDFVEGVKNDVLWAQVGGQCGSWSATGTWEDFHRFYGGTVTVDSVLIRVSGTAAPATMGAGLLFDQFDIESSTVPAMPPLGIPTAPASASATVTATDVVVTGAAVVANGCAPVTEYTVTFTPDGGGTPITYTSPTPNFTVPRPTVGVYTVTLLASNSLGDGTPAPAGSITVTAPPAPPAPPTGPTTPTTRGSSVSTAPSGPTGFLGFVDGDPADDEPADDEPVATEEPDDAPEVIAEGPGGKIHFEANPVIDWTFPWIWVLVALAVIAATWYALRRRSRSKS